MAVGLSFKATILDFTAGLNLASRALVMSLVKVAMPQARGGYELIWMTKLELLFVFSLRSIPLEIGNECVSVDVK